MPPPSMACSCCSRRSTRPTWNWRASCCARARARPRPRSSRWSASTAATCRRSKVVPERFAALAPLLPRAGRRSPRAAWRRRRCARCGGSAIGSALIGTALMSATIPARCSRKFAGDADSATLNGYTRAMWIKICGITSADAVAAAAEAEVDAIGFVFAPSPRQVTPGQAAQLAALAPPGSCASRWPSIPADEGRRDLPDSQAGLLSNRRRGFARIEDSRRTSRCCRWCASAARRRIPCRRACCSKARRAASASWPIGGGRRSSRGRPR
jgi:hypothetical protein